MGPDMLRQKGSRWLLAGDNTAAHHFMGRSFVHGAVVRLAVRLVALEEIKDCEGQQRCRKHTHHFGATLQSEGRDGKAGNARNQRCTFVSVQPKPKCDCAEKRTPPLPKNTDGQQRHATD